jgi:hypothetical protein
MALIAVLPLTIALTLVGMVAISWPNPDGLKAKFDRIENGMTRDEVVAILGRPHGVTKGAGAMMDGGRSFCFWADEDQRVAITFDGNRRVEIKDCHNVHYVK